MKPWRLTWRSLLCSSCVLLTVYQAFAQDLSPMWNTAKRIQLGLDPPPTGQRANTIWPSSTHFVFPPNNPDIRVFGTIYSLTEPRIGVSWSNSNYLAATCNGHISTTVSTPWAFSTDGGSTWPPQLQSENPPPGIINNYGGPIIFFDVNGRAYYEVLGSPGGLYFVSTTDFGVTWSPRTNADVLNSTLDDLSYASADPSGTYPHHVYAAWTDFNVSTNPVQFAYSSDQGATWSSRRTLAVGSYRGQGPCIDTGPNGEVYVVWAQYASGTAEVGIGFTKSTDGGFSFATPVVAFPIAGIRVSNGGIAEFNGARVASFPSLDVDRSNGPRRGWIYITYPDRSLGQSNVYVRRSTDSGATWSDTIHVSAPPISPEKQSWLPSIGVDQTTGDFTVSYTSMDSPGANFETNRYAARSTDGGDSWERWIISDVPSLWPRPGNPNTPSTHNNDRNSTVAHDGKAWTVWSDYRDSMWTVWLERAVYHEQGSITVVSPNGGEVWKPGAHRIVWKQERVDTVRIEYSLTGSNGPWTLVASDFVSEPIVRMHPKYHVRPIEGGMWVDSLRSLVVSFPESTSSGNCYFRISDKNEPLVADVNDSSFTISPVAYSFWRRQSYGTGPSLYAVKVVPYDEIWAGGEGGILIHSVDGGTTWQPHIISPDDVFAIERTNDHVLLVATASSSSSSIYRSTDNGATWLQAYVQAGGFINGIRAEYSGPTAFAWGDPVGGKWTILKTTDTGVTWNRIPTEPDQIGSEKGWTHAFSYVDWGELSFGTNSGRVYFSTDQGQTWSYNDNVFVPADSNVFALNPVFAGARNGAISASTDAGATWTPRSTIIGSVMEISSPQMSQWSWAASMYGKIYFAGDNGDHWSANGPRGYDSLAEFYDMDIIGGVSVIEGWAVGADGAIVRYGELMGAVEQSASTQPHRFMLEQNYPNPFNPKTEIRYQTSEAGFVTLKVFDVLGREVTTLVNEVKQPGTYTVQFDGDGLASGVYFYRFSTASYTHTRKMLLTR